ncbi:beta-mannosidase [Paenibacillus anaericanus]|uniref:glycoside hydrolase family 2 protein n=1 Tax=Paenibacillus anaericanus TaxID=170367 RepID=UPI002789A9A5|nr:glycoside hydrolase family 2 TIM barrel-domain containing protein [Paenibacillus anaericanus]MDQ0091329.1 beta-mannosidase [Paenibacillus anaericanus]
MKEILLNDLKWEIKGYWPWVPLKGTSMELGQELMGVTDWIPATVPGGIHYDLYRHGWIAHPYSDLNSLNCEWVENRWWVYRTTLSRPPCQSAARIELVFQGLDYEAAVYADNLMLGEHKGMYETAIFDVTDLLAQRETLEISVLLKQAPDEMGQIGKTSATFTQKSRFNYKWDFSTRLVNVGIWDNVMLRVHQDFSFGEISVTTDTKVDAHVSEDMTGLINIQADINLIAGSIEEQILTVQIICTDPDGSLQVMKSIPVYNGDVLQAELCIPQPQLWYPNGYGEQPLYTLELKLLAEDGTELDLRHLSTGIRKLEYRHNEGSPVDALPYTVVINGECIYMKGVNMTPLDHLYGNVTVEQYEMMIRLMKAAHINLVRIWGGGIIEKTTFYDMCDANGIMVWQEFIQSSSGVDNIPSKQPEFLELLHKTACTALCDKRNHVSLTIWSGGNELMSEPNKPSNYSDSNLAMLKGLVERYDPGRLFLPTSASGPVEYITEEKGQGHDVHGHWKYMGNPYHYELYGSNDNMLHSEFGVDGLSSIKSLSKFLSEDHLNPVSMENSVVWRHHGEWWDTLSREEELFGSMKDLRQFSVCSQWIQAEGIRFILESNLRRKFQNSGSIIWQLNEPWPNVTCTNLVDYYGETKMAYHWVKQAFRPLHVSLDYRSLQLYPGSRFQGPVYVHSRDVDRIEFNAEVLDASGRIIHRQVFEVEGTDDRAVSAGMLDFTVPELEDTLVFIRFSISEGERGRQESFYVFSTSKERLYAPALALEGGKLIVQHEESWQEMASEAGSWKSRYRITNAGSEVLLHIHAEESSNRYWMEADEQFFTLFPGESRTVCISCTSKRAGGFLAQENYHINDGQPEVEFLSFLTV